MILRSAPLALALAFAPQLSAQLQTFVSPLGHASVEGNWGNKFPWYADSSVCRRYQQIHSDLPAGSKLLRRLAWRRDSSTSVGLGARALTCELVMAPAASATGSFLFAANYAVPPTSVVPMGAINLPPLASTSTPAAFEVQVPFTVPFLAPPSGPLLWELRTATTTTGTSAFLDAVLGATTIATPGVVGTACRAVGASSDMNLVMLSADALGTFLLSWYVSDTAPLAPVFLAFGLSNPNLPIAGLCGDLYTDLVVTMPIGVSDGNGFLGLTWVHSTGTGRSGGGSYGLIVPNHFPGATLYAQAHAIGPAVSGTLPIVNSSGRKIVVPNVNTGAAYGVTRFYSYDSPSAAGATAGPYQVGAGLVTEFAY